MNKEINSFKENISLVDFIEYFGGVINRHKSTRNSFLMDFHDTKLVIKRNVNGHYIYFDLVNTANNGTIIDFYQKVVKKDSDFKNTVIAIRKFFKNGYIPSEKLEISTGVDEAFDYLKITQKIDSADITNITLSREISKNTIHEFEKVILKDIRENLCFPCFEYYFDENEKFKFNLSGLEIKNLKTNFKSQQGKKGLWGQKIGKSEDIYIFESAFDAISFRELYQKNGFYVSMGGTISLKQIEYLVAIIEYSKTENIYLCLDNDDAGNKMAEDIINDLKSLNKNIQRVLPKTKDFNEDLKETKKGVF